MTRFAETGDDRAIDVAQSDIGDVTEASVTLEGPFPLPSSRRIRQTGLQDDRLVALPHRRVWAIAEATAAAAIQAASNGGGAPTAQPGL